MDVSKHTSLSKQGDPLSLNTESFSGRSSLTSQHLEDFLSIRHRPLLDKFGSRVLKNRKFLAGFESYQRAMDSNWGKAVEPELRKAFQHYLTAWLLRLAGMEDLQIRREVGGGKFVGWILYGKVPYVIHQHDPVRISNRRQHVRIPTQESAPFAYLSGAFVASITPNSSFSRISFHSRERAVIDRLLVALERGCGISSKIIEHYIKGYYYYSVNVGHRDLLDYLKVQSSGCRAVPWRHIQSSAERRAFLHGFLDFTGGSMQEKYARFCVSKIGNLELLSQVGVVFLREGIYPRIESGKTSHLIFDELAELKALNKLGVVQTMRLKEPLEKISGRTSGINYRTAEDYQEFLSVRRDLGEEACITPVQMQRAMTLAGCKAKLPTALLKTWLRHHVPPQFDRLKKLEKIEAEIFSGKNRATVGNSILERDPKLKDKPEQLVAVLSDWFGGVSLLSERSQISKERLIDIKRLNAYPTEVEFGKLADSIGVEVHSLRTHLDYLPKGIAIYGLVPPAKLGIFRNYEASIRGAMRNEIAQGNDPRGILYQKLYELGKRGGARI